MLILLLLQISSSLDLKRSIEGFFTGFESTDFYLGSDCISESWQQSLKSSLISIQSGDFLTNPNTLLSLYSSINSFISSCHPREISEILFYLVSLDQIDYILHTVLHLPTIYSEIIKINTTDDFLLYKGLGKVFRVWVDEKLDKKYYRIGEIFYSFLLNIADKNDVCAQIMLYAKMYLNTPGEYPRAKREFKVWVNDWKNYVKHCKLQSFIDKVNDSLGIKGFIKYGMNSKQIKSIIAQILSSDIDENYNEIGDLIYDIISIIID
jgi:hypothetical protein